jgi:uncharacterized membrane protein YgcG
MEVHPTSVARVSSLRAFGLMGIVLCMMTATAPAAVYQAKSPLFPSDVERELCLDRKTGLTEAYLRLPIPVGLAGGDASQSSAYASLKQVIPPSPLFIEYGPAMRLARSCCPARVDQQQPEPSVTANDLPMAAFSTLTTAPVGYGGPFFTTLPLQTIREDDAEPVGCSSAAWSGGELDGGLDGDLTGGGSFRGTASGGGSGSGSGGGGGSRGSSGGAWGSSPGTGGQPSLGIDETTPLFPLIPLVTDPNPRGELFPLIPLVTLPNTPSEPKVVSPDLPKNDPEDRIVITPPPLKAVPGPIAGAGLPVLLALGGFVWARRRKAAARA